MWPEQGEITIGKRRTPTDRMVPQPTFPSSFLFPSPLSSLDALSITEGSEAGATMTSFLRASTASDSFSKRF